MASQPPPAPQPPRAAPTVEAMRRGIARLEKRLGELYAFRPETIQHRFDHRLEALSISVQETLTAVFGAGTGDYDRYAPAVQLDLGVQAVGMSGNDQESLTTIRSDVMKGVLRSMALLRRAIEFLQEEIADQEQRGAVVPLRVSPAMPPGQKVFLVHGHDDAALQTVARFLERIGLEVIVLSEQPDQGRTIIEKFEACAADVGFAVVLLTPDDVAGSAAAPATDRRTRQNVMFELGYFAGKLGRERACLMRKGVVEIPSDLHGVIYTDLDAGGGWKSKLTRELHAAGLNADPSWVVK